MKVVRGGGQGNERLSHGCGRRRRAGAAQDPPHPMPWLERRLLAAATNATNTNSTTERLNFYNDHQYQKQNTHLFEMVWRSSRRLLKVPRLRWRRLMLQKKISTGKVKLRGRWVGGGYKYVLREGGGGQKRRAAMKAWGGAWGGKKPPDDAPVRCERPRRAWRTWEPQCLFIMCATYLHVYLTFSFLYLEKMNIPLLYNLNFNLSQYFF